MAKNKKTTAGATTPAVNSKEATPTVETPAVETPAVETPAVETPAVENSEASEDLEPHFVHGGKAYTLPHHVKQLQINGIVHSRKEILTNDDIMTTLIVGNSPFVKKI